MSQTCKTCRWFVLTERRPVAGECGRFSVKGKIHRAYANRGCGEWAVNPVSEREFPDNPKANDKFDEAFRDHWTNAANRKQNTNEKTNP